MGEIASPFRTSGNGLATLVTDVGPVPPLRRRKGATFVERITRWQESAMRAEMTILARRFVEVRHDLYGDHGGPLLAKAMP